MSNLAYVLTRFQFNILLATLANLQIEKAAVCLVIDEKARQQGVNGDGFLEVMHYRPRNSLGIGDWKNLKDENHEFIAKLTGVPENIFIRNVDSPLGRMLISRFSRSNIYLLEDGLGSYSKRSYLGLRGSLKDRVYALLCRYYFSDGKLKYVPVEKTRTIKVGLFQCVEPWLNVPYLQIDLANVLLKDAAKETGEVYSCDVLIIDQPLTNAGFSVEKTIEAYRKLFEIVREREGVESSRVYIKKHPSSNSEFLTRILNELKVKEDYRLIDSTSCVEELFLTGRLPDVRTVVSFNSSSLYVLKSLDFANRLEFEAYKPFNCPPLFESNYRALQSLGIEVRSY